MTDLILQSLFGEIAALLMIAAVVGLAGHLLRQPLIVSFIAVGLLVGPSGVDIARADAEINLLSQLGIAILLFLVGIKLDVKLIRSLGSVALVTGLGQVAFTSIFGFIIGLALGLDSITSLYVSVALTFSSTIIIVKLLSDKREIDSLHGQVALGFLIVQDLVVVLAMVVLSTLGIATPEGGDTTIAFVLAGALALLGGVVVFVRYVANPLTERLARSPELLVTFAIGQASLFAAIGDAIGLGKELGGLLAGVSLASTPYREAIVARLAPLRDFLLLFFFIALGTGLELGNLGASTLPAVVFSVFVLVGNPLIVLVLMGAMGFRKRTGFLAGLTVAQISEFSLIFVAMGVSLGHVGEAALGLVTLVGLITIATSTYMITYSHRLYALFEPLLGPFERRNTPREPRSDIEPTDRSFDFVVLGLGRFGTAIGQRLVQAGGRVLGVDFDPGAVRRWQALGLAAEYGDASDPEFVATLPLAGAKWVVATVPPHAAGVVDGDVRRTIIQAVRAAGLPTRVAVAAHSEEDIRALAESGAALVLEPFQDAADRAVELLYDAPGMVRADAAAASP